jgi:hypothetical protein
VQRLLAQLERAKRPEATLVKSTHAAPASALIAAAAGSSSSSSRLGRVRPPPAEVTGLDGEGLARVIAVDEARGVAAPACSGTSRI